MAHSLRVIRTNSLIVLLPPALFSNELLPLFEAHFTESYGTLISFTALEKLGRVLIVYNSIQSATEAKEEMDHFKWEDDIESEPIRVFYGPSFSLPLESLHQTLLAVPALSKNFLISPPGSPPVGWEQILEEKPNVKSHHDGDEAWSNELERALRFLSVGPNNDEEEEENDKGERRSSETINIIPSTIDSLRPAITLSSPFDTSEASTPPTESNRITAVKATIESMLGRRKSFSASSLDAGLPSRIIPTARPPTEDIATFRNLNIG